MTEHTPTVDQGRARFAYRHDAPGQHDPEWAAQFDRMIAAVEVAARADRLEVTDEMVERAELRIRSMLLNLDDGEDNALRIASAALSAALGGGE